MSTEEPTLVWTIIDFDRYRHFRNAHVPWLKLHRDTMAAPSWCMVSDRTKVVRVALLLMATIRGMPEVPANLEYLKEMTRLRCSIDELRESINELIEHQFIAETASFTFAEHSPFVVSTPQHGLSATATNKRPVEIQRCSCLPGVDTAAFIRWVEYRTRCRKPIRTEGLQRMARFMARLGERQMEAVKHSMDMGYQGLFLPGTARAFDVPSKAGGARAGTGGPRFTSRPNDPIPLSHDERETNDLASLMARRAQIGIGDFRDPLPGESASAYRHAQDDEWTARKVKRVQVRSDIMPNPRRIIKEK